MFVDEVASELTVATLKPFHLDDWFVKHPDWASGTKNGMCRAVQRALRWAERRGRIERSPVAFHEKPRLGRRAVVISPAELERMIACVRQREIRDLIMVIRETAARPQESLVVAAPLFGERRYFHLTRTGEAAIGEAEQGSRRRAGAFSEIAKVRAYGVLAFCCPSGRPRRRLTLEEFRRNFPEHHRSEIGAEAPHPRGATPRNPSRDVPSFTCASRLVLCPAQNPAPCHGGPCPPYELAPEGLM